MITSSCDYKNLKKTTIIEAAMSISPPFSKKKYGNMFSLFQCDVRLFSLFKKFLSQEKEITNWDLNICLAVIVSSVIQ